MVEESSNSKENSQTFFDSIILSDHESRNRDFDIKNLVESLLREVTSLRNEVAQLKSEVSVLKPPQY